MKKILLVFPNLSKPGGPQNAFVNFLNLLPYDKYHYELLLTNRRYEKAIDFSDDVSQQDLWDRIPKYINILPPLYQLGKYSEELLSDLRKDGLGYMADIRKNIRIRNAQEGEDRLRNWEELKKIVPEYSGYDIAVAYTEDIALQIVVDKVFASRKICWVHSDYIHVHEKVVSKKNALWEKMNTIICVSQQNARSFANRYPNLQERIKVIYNSNDSAYIERNAKEFYPQEYIEAKDCIKIFTSAAIIAYKGPDLLFYSAKELLNAGYNVRWFIAGDTLERKYVQMLNEMNLGKNVVLLGFKRNPYPYFANCDIYVHPSRHEGLSVAIQEAKILCKPILVTNHSSVDEVIKDGETGLICDINVEGIVQKLKMLIDDKELRERLSLNLKNQSNISNDTANIEEIFN
ncbi:MAG: glycosyltransferase [Fibromonadales bacterium]|nr:glycosyltransferase [Fibromonadales bacterium]